MAKHFRPLANITHDRRDKRHKAIVDQRKTNFRVSLSDFDCSPFYFAFDHPSSGGQEEFKCRIYTIRYLQNRAETDIDKENVWRRFAACKEFAV